MTKRNPSRQRRLAILFFLCSQHSLLFELYNPLQTGKKSKKKKTENKKKEKKSKKDEQPDETKTAEKKMLKDAKKEPILVSIFCR